MAADQKLSDILVEFARTMVTDFSVQAILDHLVARILDIVPATGAAASMDAANLGNGYSAISDISVSLFQSVQSGFIDTPRRAASMTGEAVVIEDSRTETRFLDVASRALDVGLMALFVFPLRNGIHPVGTLELYYDAPGALPPEAMAAAQTLADVSAVYLFNAQVRADLQDSSRKDRYAALHDPLTGLPNRVLILERLKHALAKARRSGKTSAVFFVDLDRFKNVNDTYGHRVGDELLVGIAKRLTGLLRPGDTMARLSGDEFVILCEDLDNPAEAARIVQRVEQALGTPFALEGVEIAVTVSIGVVVGSADDSAEQILDDADVAMYRAKRKGGARAEVLDVNDVRTFAPSHRLEQDLRDESWSRRMSLDYQPIVASADDRILGVEAFLRWNHPTQGVVSPAVLLPLAEHCGLAVELGRWVLEQVCTQHRHWQAERGGSDVSLSVNVSPSQLMAGGFAANVSSALRAAEMDPGLLTFEMTERAFIDDSMRALVVLHDLKDIGVTLALDHFETGHASLSYLERFPVDVLKIDRTFVTGLGRNSTSRIIVGAIVELAHELGLRVTAEGVETADEHDHVVRLGCDSYQGYYFARPMTATDVGALLHGGALRSS